ncbi:dTDP-4-dehydrorhamnose reductase [Burkholderia pyrrocinia]
MREVDVKAEPTILVTGVNGQVGFELLRSLQGLGRVVACDRSMLDLSDLDRVRDVVRELKPSIIVNPAAYTAVDKAETDQEAARRLNADVPRVLAEEAARSGAALVHYSTDYVFDGAKDGEYCEADLPDPQNVYGLTKLEGEAAIASAGCRHLILRTSWVYGARGHNFLLTMLRLGAERSELKVVADQLGAPTWSHAIAAATSHMIAQARGAPDATEWWDARSGTYHLTAGGDTSWHGFASAIFELANLPKRPVVLPIPAADYPTPAKRPSNSRLSNTKLAQVFGVVMPHWRESLGLCLAGMQRT